MDKLYKAGGSGDGGEPIKDKDLYFSHEKHFTNITNKGHVSYMPIDQSS
jgi:hypothetical protein